MDIRVAVLDHDGAFRKALTEHLGGVAGVKVARVAADEVVERAKAGELDVVFLDAELKEAAALPLLEELKRVRPELEVVVVTDSGRMEPAVRAMRLGAGDFLAKPLKPEQVALAIDRARRVQKLVEENRRLKEQLRDRYAARSLVGATPEMRRLHEMIDAAREGTGPALICGEPGTERELVARAMHEEGPRKDRRFVKVDGAAAEGALVSEPRWGEAETVYVEEVDRLAPAQQDLLLRAVRDGLGRGTGGADTAVTARVIGGTGANLLEAVGRGLFRRELMEALSGTTLAVPPLRARRDDIPLVVDAILRRRAAAGRKSARAASPEALSTLMAADWPGNVRELEQAVERACELGDGEWLERRHLPPSVIQAAEARRKVGDVEVTTRSLREMESEVILRMLSEHKGDTEIVSRLLKIDRSTLYRKIKRYGIDLDELKPS